MEDTARSRNRDLRDEEEMERLDDRELLRLILRRENKILDVVERLSLDQRHLQIAVDDLVEQNAELSTQQQRLQEENAALRRQMGTIRRIGETVPRFTCFTRLPPEIRFRIWDFSLPCRFVRVARRGDITGGEDGLDKQSKHSPPAISQVCHEARAIALRTAGFKAVQYGREYIMGPRGFPYSRPNEREWTWFDWTRDTFMLPTWIAGSENYDDMDLCQVVQHVFLEDLDACLGTALDALFDSQVYPNLRSLSFVVYQEKLDYSVDIPAPSPTSAQRRLPDAPYYEVDIEHLEGVVAMNWPNTKGDYDEETWTLENNNDDGWFDEAGDPIVKWPGFLKKLAEMWKSRRGQDPIPSFRRVAVLNHFNQGILNPAWYFGG